jgi:hypothetical protein
MVMVWISFGSWIAHEPPTAAGTLRESEVIALGREAVGSGPAMAGSILV